MNFATALLWDKADHTLPCYVMIVLCLLGKIASMFVLLCTGVSVLSSLHENVNACVDGQQAMCQEAQARASLAL